MYQVAPLDFGNVVAGSTSAPVNVNGTYFYMRATGYLIPSVTGLYTIGVNCADGCSVFIGSQAIVANLTGLDTAHATLAYTQSGTIMLTKNVYYPLIIEWQHGSGSPYELQLIWTPPNGGITALVPSANLSDSATSITNVLDVSWWNGTSGLWYPGGNGTIDFSNGAHPNKTLDYIADGSLRKILPASGNGTSFATATSSISSEGANVIVLTDGSGNITATGSVLLSSLLSLSGGEITGALTVDSTFTAKANSSVQGILTLGLSGSSAGYLKLAQTTAYATTVTGAATANWTLTLPVTAGTSGYILQTNGAGVTSWVAPLITSGAGIPAGATTNGYLYINTSGTHAATSLLYIYDATTTSWIGIA